MKQSILGGRGIQFLAVGALTLAMSLAAQANLIQNGGFENGTTGWSGDVNLVSRLSDGLAAYDGRVSAALDTGDSLSTKAFSTSVGQQYTLTFYLATSGGCLSMSDLNVSVSANGKSCWSVSTCPGDFVNMGNTDWAKCTASFIASSSSTILTFNNYSFFILPGETVALDDIDLETAGSSCTPTAVPEAGTVMAGLLLLIPLGMSAGRVLARRRA